MKQRITKGNAIAKYNTVEFTIWEPGTFSPDILAKGKVKVPQTIPPEALNAAIMGAVAQIGDETTKREAKEAAAIAAAEPKRGFFGW